jgi:WD40 repeat protein
MNLVAASQKSPLIYIAHEDTVGIMPTPFKEGLSELPNYDCKLSRAFPDDGSEGYLLGRYVHISPYHLLIQPYAITNMHVGEIGNEEVLITTDDSGHVTIHFTNSTRPPFVVKVASSAWGIDTHSSKRLVGISCNAHVIYLFHLGMGLDGWEWTTSMPEVGEIFPNLILRRHLGNIPCVAFDKTGNYIASGSLDCSVKLWDCSNGNLIKHVGTEDTYTPQMKTNQVFGLFGL